MARVSGNRIIERALLLGDHGGCRTAAPSPTPCARPGEFPSMVIQLVATGEESGTLPAMLGESRRLLRAAGGQHGRHPVDADRADHDRDHGGDRGGRDLRPLSADLHPRPGDQGESGSVDQGRGRDEPPGSVLPRVPSPVRGVLAADGRVGGGAAASCFSTSRGRSSASSEASRRSRPPPLLFGGAGLAGAAAAVAGLVVGLRLAGRIRVIVKKAEALSPPTASAQPPQKVTDELGALDAAVGRLTLSIDQFVRDSDILSRLPGGHAPRPADGRARVLQHHGRDPPRSLARAIPRRADPLAGRGLPAGNEATRPWPQLLCDATARQQSAHMSEVSATSADRSGAAAWR